MARNSYPQDWPQRYSEQSSLASTNVEIKARFIVSYTIGLKRWSYCMTNFYSFNGTVTEICDFYTGQNGTKEDCYKFITVEKWIRSHSKFRGVTHHLLCRPCNCESGRSRDWIL